MLIATILVAGVLVTMLWVAVARPTLKGDTAGVVTGASRAVRCMRHAVFTDCEAWRRTRGAGADPRTWRVGPWPLIQFVPAIALRSVGVSTDTTLRLLIAGNAVSLGVLLGIAWVTLRRLAAPLWAPILAVVLLTGPVLWYGTSAFGEVPGATLVVAAVAAVLLRSKPWVVGTLVMLACLTKETNPAFIAVLVALCLVVDPDAVPDRRRWSTRLVPVGIGLAAGVAANAAFNVFRFGTVGNTIYLEPAFHAPDAGIVSRAFFAQWFAPNGGILWFWPTAVALLVIAAAGAIAGLRRSRRTWAQVVPLAIGALLIAQIAGLSTWFSPFGWRAWGPRLTLTLLPAMLLIVCVVGNRHATAILRRGLASPGFWAAAVLVILCGLPQAAVVFQPRAIDDFFLTVERHCPPDAHVWNKPTAYYRCVDDAAWRTRPLLLERGLDGLDTAGGRILVTITSCASLALLLVSRATSRNGARPTFDGALEARSGTRRSSDRGFDGDDV